MKPKIRLMIKGKRWDIYLQSEKVYDINHGKGSEAITYSSTRKIFFRKSNVTLAVIRHELLHAFVAETNMESAGLNSDQLEEVIASLLEHQWFELSGCAELIANAFMK